MKTREQLGGIYAASITAYDAGAGWTPQPCRP